MATRGGRRLVASGLIAVAAAAFALVVGLRLEPGLADEALALVAPAPDDRVVVLAIDEDTVDGLPARSPVDRQFLAEVVRAVDAARPAAIGLDLLLSRPTDAAKDAALREAIATAQAPVIIAWEEANVRGGDTAQGLSRRETEFAASFGARRGRADLPRDIADGLVRQLPEAGAVPPFALALSEVAGGPGVMPAGRIVWADGAFPVYSARLASMLPAAWLEGKIVLVGTDLAEVDRHRTPWAAGEGGDAPGVVIHAHIVSQILSGLERLPAPVWLVALLALAGAAAGTALRPLSPAVAAAAALGAVVAYGALAAAVVAFTPATPPLATPVLAFLFAAAGTALDRWSLDRRERARVEAMFGRYVSPRVVARLVASGEEPRLGGERREVTHLFTDLEDFTSLAETLPPDTTAAVLNGLLEVILAAIVEADGTVDKIVGDAVVAFFGAPEAQRDHGARAVAAARRIHVATETERARWRARGVEVGRTRVGVHTGVAVVGNFGGRRFFDYTAVGDSVNVAARLEAANRVTGTSVLVSTATRERATGAFRPVGRILVRGRRETVEAWEPVDAADPAYAAAFAAMAEGRPDALDRFEALARAAPDDRLVAAHLARLRAGAPDDIVAG